MKHKIIFILMAIVALSTGCIKNNPKIENFESDNVAFSYKVVGSYSIDYYVGSNIEFTNNSIISGECTWDFGDGTVSKSSAPTIMHDYLAAGHYTVRLTINGESSSAKIYISDIIPNLSLMPIEDICEVNLTFVEPIVVLPNPQDLEEEYRWKFPEGTLDETDTPITEIVTNKSNPQPGKFKFSGVGSQKIILETTLGGRRLADSELNIQVGYNTPVKTLYYAVKDGNINAYKLFEDANINNSPFDLGVKSGAHPLNILFGNDELYVLDAGKQFTFINDADDVYGDGKINAISKDGKTVQLVLTNVGNTAFNDPYFGYYDETSKLIYFSDRNTGVARISSDKRNETMDKQNSNRSLYPFWVQNATLGYYGDGSYAYGAMNACIHKVGNTWWWAKTYNGTGIFRFTDADILPSPIAAGGGSKPFPILFPNIFIKSFVVDETRGLVYIAVYSGNDTGIYRIPIADIEKITSSNQLGSYLVSKLAVDSEGSTGEFIAICQMVLDPEDGSVYFGYRSGDASVKSAVMKCGPTGGLTRVVDGVAVYGITINNKKTKLF